MSGAYGAPLSLPTTQGLRREVCVCTYQNALRGFKIVSVDLSLEPILVYIIPIGLIGFNDLPIFQPLHSASREALHSAREGNVLERNMH